MVVAAIFGCLAQIGVRPSSPQPNVSSAAVAEAAEKLFEAINSDVASGIQTRLKSREIGSRDLDGVVALLNSCAARLREAGFEEKLNSASRQVALVQTQVLAVLKDPGNKEIFAAGLDPERCINQIKLQQASGAILEKKIQRLRNTIEELRKCSAILEAVTPPEQLSERIRLRLTQLLSEWRGGGGTSAEVSDPGMNEITETEPQKLTVPVPRSNDSSDKRPHPPTRERSPNLGIEIISVPVDNNGPVAKVLRMTREGSPEKLILKYILGCSQPFRIRSADEILELREQGVSSSVIAAMLRHDDQLRGAIGIGRHN